MRTGSAGVAARNGGRFGLAALMVILLLGLGLRVGVAWDGRSPVYDAVAYAEIAERLSDGDGFSLGAKATQPASNYSPGLPLFVAGVYELTGGVHERLARLVLAAIGSLAMLFTYLLGRRLSGMAAGLIGAGAVAVYPALLEYHSMLMGEPLAATLLSGVVLALLWASDAGSAAQRAGPAAAALPHVLGRRFASPSAMGDPRHRVTRAMRWLLPGLLLGATAMIRPEYVSVAVLIAAVTVAWARPRWRVGLANAAILLAGVALVVAPWTIRNVVVLDRLVPVSTGGGQVLFAGSYMPSGGDPERVGREVLERHPGLTRQLSSSFIGHRTTNSELVTTVVQKLRLEQILAALAAQRYPGTETDAALGRMGRERLWDDLTERPLEYGGVVATKVWRAWSRGPREVMERPGWRLFHGALVLLALAGLVSLLPTRPREALLLATILVAVTAIVALLVASPRRVLVTVPLLSALAGAGVVWAATAFGEHRPWTGRRSPEISA